MQTNQMTTGEMLEWTKRFNQIIGAAQTLKNRRLQKLQEDILLAYHGRPNVHAAYMVVAVNEEMEG